MTEQEIDSLVDCLSSPPAFTCSHVLLERLIRLELAHNWDAMPGETRCVLLGAAAVLRNLLHPGSMLAETIAETISADWKRKGGRKPGSKERATVYIVELLQKNPDAKPAEIVDEIFRRADEDQSPFVIDDCCEDVLIDVDKSKTLDRIALAAKVAKAKHQYKKAVKNSERQIFQKLQMEDRPH